jgi:hypothetical protein
MPSSDEIGDRGESIFEVRITRPCGPGGEPLFRPYFLGEKKATLDFLVELLGLDGRSAYFFVQVKATARPASKRAGKLPVRMQRRDLDRMVAYPGPTYLVGVDVKAEEGYILSVNEPMDGDLVGLPLIYPMDCTNLGILWKEVDDYWKSKDMAMNHSAFTI